MSKNRPGIDQHIVIALEHIHWPIVTPKGKKFFIRKNARDRTGIEHIAEKRHHLKIVDIDVLPLYWPTLFANVEIQRINRVGIIWGDVVANRTGRS